MMKLIGSHQSPYVRKVRIVLAEKQVDYEFVIGNVMAYDDQWVKNNPLYKIPSLLLDDGLPLYDSRVIVEYVDTLGTAAPLIPSEPRERAAVRRWEALADGALDAGILARWEAVQRTEDRQDPAWIDRQNRKILGGLEAMSTGLGDAQFCHGASLSLADLAVGTALGWFAFRFPDIAWAEDYPNLAGLYARMSERASFAATVPAI